MTPVPLGSLSPDFRRWEEGQTSSSTDCYPNKGSPVGGDLVDVFLQLECGFSACMARPDRRPSLGPKSMLSIPGSKALLPLRTFGQDRLEGGGVFIFTSVDWR